MADIEDTKDELRELESAVEDITSKMEFLASQAFGDKLVDKFAASAKEVSDLATHLEVIAKSYKDFETGADLQKAMVKDAKLFKEVQEKILSSQGDVLADTTDIFIKLQSQLDVMEDAEAIAQVQHQVWGQISDLQDDSRETLEAQLNVLAQQASETKGIKKVLQGIGEVVPSAFVKFLKDLPGALKKALTAESFESSIEAFSKPIDDLLDSIPAVGGVLKGAFQLLRKSFFSVWDYIEQRVLPTNVRLTKQFGALTPETRKLGQAAVSMGDQFERMGKGLGGPAREAVVDFGAALKTVNLTDPTASMKEQRKQMSELANMGVRLTQVLGMSAAEAGNLQVAFDRAGPPGEHLQESIQRLEKSMVEAAVVASDFGVPIAQVQKDMGQFPNVLQRFGAANSLEFSKAAAMARAYGTSIGEVNAAFGQQLDTFEGSAEAAAKLNAVFGSNINSFELMMETNPAKRMAMVGDAVTKASKPWSEMNVQMRNVIKSTLNIDDKMGALVFSQKNVSKGSSAMVETFKKQQERQESLQKAQERWDSSIRGLRTQLLNFEESIDRIVRAIGNVIAKFLGMDSATKGTVKTAQMLEKIFNKVAVAIEQWAATGGVERLKEQVSNLLGMAERALDGPLGWLLGVEDKETRTNKQIEALTKKLTLEKEHADKIAERRLELIKEIEAAEGKSSQKRLMQEMEGIKEQQLAALAALGITEEERNKLLSKRKDLTAVSAASKEVGTWERQNVGGGRRFDTLITDQGKEYQFSPKDNILATQAPIAEILPKLSEVVNMATNTQSAGIDVALSTELRALTQAIRDLKQQDNNRGGNNIKIELADVVLDGRKIGEAQVRLSRA